MTSLSLLGRSSVRTSEAASAQDPDPRLAFLCEARKSINTEQLNQMILDRVEQNDAIDKFIAQWKVKARVGLEEQHEESKRLVREQQQRIEDLQLTIDRLDQRAGQLGNAAQKSEHALNQAKAEANGLSRFAPKSEVIAAQKAVADAEARFEKIQAELALPESQSRFHKLTTLPKLHGELQVLMAEEARLASALSGEPFHDASGLILPPGARF